MQDKMNELAVQAKADMRARDSFIRDREQTILKMASAALGRYITRSDDEWSVALYAFSKAIDSYDMDKGSFYAYARMLIRQDLIDEQRRGAKYASEVLTAPYVMEGNAEPEEDPDHVLQAVARESMREEGGGRSLREEILEAGREFAGIGFSFFDLTACSPKQERTREACAVVIRWILEQDGMVNGIRKNGQLPGARIRSGTGASEKLLEKYRKYILAAILILSGDYPGLQEYLKYIRKGG